MLINPFPIEKCRDPKIRTIEKACNSLIIVRNDISTIAWRPGCLVGPNFSDPERAQCIKPSSPCLCREADQAQWRH